MAFAVSKIFVSLYFAFAFFISGVLGGTVCEQLDRSICAFAVSSSGYRCVLEKHVRESGRKVVYSCQTSAVELVGVAGWIESEQCIEACGLDQHTLGISSDFLLERQFMRRLCSSECYQECPNIVDLYFNLAAGEGVFLPNLCRAKTNKRREIEEIKSSLKVMAPGRPVWHAHLRRQRWPDYGSGETSARARGGEDKLISLGGIRHE